MAKLNLRESKSKQKWCSDKIEKFVHDTVREAWMPPLPYEVGKTYIFRTVSMCDIGTVIAIVGNFLVLDDDAVWVSNAGSWDKFLNNDLELSKIHKFRKPVQLNTSTIVDSSEWEWSIPNGTQAQSGTTTNNWS